MAKFSRSSTKKSKFSYYEKPLTDEELVQKHQQAGYRIDQYNKTVREGGYLSPEALADYESARKEYIGTGNAIQSRSEAAGGLPDPRWQSRIADVTSSYNQVYDYYSNWNTEEEWFKGAQENWQKRQQRYETNQQKIEALTAERKKIDPGIAHPAARAATRNRYGVRLDEIDAEIAALEAENAQYKRGENGWAYKKGDDHYTTTLTDDFAITSQNRDYNNPTPEQYIQLPEYSDQNQWYYDENGVYRDANGNALETDEFGNWIDPRNRDMVVEDKLGLFLNATEDQRNQGAAGNWGSNNVSEIFREGIEGDWKYLNDTEIGIYYAYLAESQEKAYAYLEDISRELDRRRALDEMGKWNKRYEESGFLGKVGMNLETVPAKFLSTIGVAVNDASNLLSGEDINPYSTAYTGMHYGSVVRGATAEDLDKTGIKLPGVDFTLGDLYQTGMSRLDSALATSLFGGAGVFFLGLGAAQSKGYELYREGASAEQITLGAFSAGAAEAIWEYISFGKLKEIEKIGNPKDWVKSMFVQGWNEGIEEGATEITNIVTDALIMGSQSGLADLYAENEEKAFQTFVDLLQQTAHAFVGGFAGGFAAGGVEGGKSYAQTTMQNTVIGADIIRRGGVENLSNLGSKFTGNNAIANAVKRVQKNATAKNVGKLYRTIADGIRSTATSTLTDSLVESGISKRIAGKVAPIMVDSFMGIEITDTQADLLDTISRDSKIADTVAQVAAEVLTSGSVGQALYDLNSIFDADTSITEDSVTEEAVPDDSVAEETVLEETAEEEAAADEILEETAEETAEDAPVVEETQVVEEAPDQQTIAEDTVPEEAAAEETPEGEAFNPDELTGLDKLLWEQAGIPPMQRKTAAKKQPAEAQEAAQKEAEPSTPAKKGNIFDVLRAKRSAKKAKPTTQKKAEPEKKSPKAEKKTTVSAVPEDIRHTVENAPNMTQAGAELILGNPKAASVEGFLSEAVRVFEGGYAGSEDVTQWLNLVTPAEAKAIYLEGRRSALADAAKAQSSVNAVFEKAAAVIKESGKKVTGELRVADGVDLSKETDPGILATANLAAEIAPSLRATIVLYSGDPARAGYYKHSEDAVYVNVNARFESGESMAAFVLAHELVHRARKGSPEMYQKFSDFLVESYGKVGYSVLEMVDVVKNDYSNSGVELTNDEALEEVICQAAERMLLDTDAGRRLAEFGKQSAENKSFVEELKQILKDIFDTLRSYFKHIKGETEASKAFAKLDRKVQQTLADMLVDMSVDAGQKLGTIKAAGMLDEINTTGKGDVRYKVLNGIAGENGILYDKVVQPGTVAFEKLKRNRKEYIKRLHEKIFNRKIPVTDIHGETIYVEFGKSGEIVKKIGAKEPHDVLGMLERTSDNLTKLAILNVKELLQNSLSEPISDENSHGWLDAFGWQDRKVMMLYHDTLYPVILHIANTEDGRHLLYEISVLKKEEQGMTRYAKAPTADTARAPVATDEHRPAVNNPVLLGESLPQSETIVKQNSSTDSDGNQLSAGQQAYFADNKSPTVDDDINNRLAVTSDYRQILADAFSQMATTQEERELVEKYQLYVKRAKENEARLSELRKKIWQMERDGAPRDDVEKLRKTADNILARLDNYDAELLKLRAAAPLRRLMARRETERVRETLHRNVEGRRKTAAKEKLRKEVLSTVRWITNPGKNDVRCPDFLKDPYEKLLSGIDFVSGDKITNKDLRVQDALNLLANALERARSAQDLEGKDQGQYHDIDSGYLDLPADFVAQLRDLAVAITNLMGYAQGGHIVDAMTTEQIENLVRAIRTLNNGIKQMDKLYGIQRFANARALGSETVQFLDKLGKVESTTSLGDFSLWTNGLPYYVFKRFGPAGEAVFEGFMNAQDRLAFLAQTIFQFQEKTWTEKQANSWSNDVHTIKLREGTVNLTTADAMSIYCLSRREQGLKHLLAGGVRIVGIEKNGKKTADVSIHLTLADIDAITNSLTAEQRKIAEAIQEFMSTVCAEWGNEISMKRFLTKDFNERFYFPIETNPMSRETKDEKGKQQSDLFRLLNISATKPIVPNAKNEVVVRNIFDVFAGHSSDMAKLNAFALPLLDYMKWMNYREITTEKVEGNTQITERGVRRAMVDAYGNAAFTYALELVKEINGKPSDSDKSIPRIFKNMIKDTKTAMVGGNLRVAFLQMTSYPRAGMVLSQKSLALGIASPWNVVRGYRMAKKYCGIALWKTFGFYDTDIAKTMESQIKGTANAKDKLVDLMMKGAELGDAATWGALWNACEYEVAATKQFKVDTEEFYKAVATKLREVIYATQVVDSVLTRSQIMRDKGMGSKMVSAFMSEPTLSANILMDAAFRIGMEKRSSGSAKVAWKTAGKYFGKAVCIYSLSQLVASAAEALSDVIRAGNDEEEKFWEAYKKAFLENLVLNLMPFNKLPILSDGANLALSVFGIGYFSSESIAYTPLTHTAKAASAIGRAFKEEGDGAAVFRAIKKTIQAVSSWTGVAAYNVLRDFIAIWNLFADEDYEIK